ncbi:hypothetical protein G7072_08975 [Nocardioides sp. HDW12B]|uniref:GyrI-like domain-containing protein n=1 Tax=Nocardioides sp. HDW12B TaxID=2714939 RepID=UPI00140A99DE|nr:GyrI-like domain-containing protein [Nocardioides sp. HDW12B]QIK66465.1 hypothetical protein G7072_08975 [Nocardioides sp. HDW12B]
MTTTKVDFRKTRDSYRARSGELRLLDVPDTTYLMVDGHGDPNTSPAFVEAVTSLYPVAYALKFASRRDLGQDYVVPPLEGLWWADDMDTFTVARDKSRWQWTLMIMAPDWLDGPHVDAALAQAGRRKDRPPRLDDVRREVLSEGRCVQTLHVGSFDDEAAVLAQIHDEFVPAHGLEMVGRHHEIYLSDFRRVAPEKRRTVLRQPVRPRGA